jgi:hypothetical protein
LDEAIHKIRKKEEGPHIGLSSPCEKISANAKAAQARADFRRMPRRAYPDSRARAYAPKIKQQKRLSYRDSLLK